MSEIESPISVRLLTPKDAARYIGYKPKTLENWRNRGVGPAYTRIGNMVRYELADLDAWIDAHKVAANG